MHVAQQRFRALPVDAGVGDGYAVTHVSTRLFGRLIALMQMALQHNAGNRAVTRFNLLHHGLRPPPADGDSLYSSCHGCNLSSGRMESRLEHLFSQAATCSAL